MRSRCDQCNALFDVSGKAPGAVFRCPKCKQGSITVPRSEPELPAAGELREIAEAPEVPASAGAGDRASRRAARAAPGTAATPAKPERARTGRTARRGGTRTSRTAGGGFTPAKVAAIVSGILVVGVGAWFVLGRGGGDADPRAEGGGTATSRSDADAGADVAPGTPRGSGGSDAAANAASEFAARRSALAPDDAAGRVALATEAETAKHAAEARELYREALLVDANEPAARQALGFTLYDGPAAQYRGRWLDKAGLDLAKAQEKFAASDALGGAVTSHDVFLRNAKDLHRSMSREFPDDEFLFAYDDGVTPAPFVVLIEKRGDFEPHRAEYAEALTTLHDAFFDRYREQFQLEEIERAIPIVVFESDDTYEEHRAANPDGKYIDSQFVGGYYQPWSQRLILWRQQGWRGVLIHEGAHLLIHYAFSGAGFTDSNESPWFQEGFAEFFGGHKAVVEVVDGVPRKRYVLGQFLPGRYATLRAMMQGGVALPVRKLVEVNHYTFGTAKDALGGWDPKKGEAPFSPGQAAALVSDIYAQGWAFIMYLHYAHDGRYRKVFDDYFAAETRGEGDWGTLQTLLGLENDEDWAALDSDFKNWVVNELGKMR